MTDPNRPPDQPPPRGEAPPPPPKTPLPPPKPGERGGDPFGPPTGSSRESATPPPGENARESGPDRERRGPPRRPERRRPRVLPVLFGLIALGAIGLVSLIGALIFLIPFGGGGFSPHFPSFGGDSPVAVLRIDDAIMPGPLYDFWMDSLDRVEKNESIQGLILRINSPGGSVAASQELYDRILSIRDAGKTVYISMGDVSASGGYYIASAADRIFANRGTLTGSIGVIATTMNLEGLAEKGGIKVTIIKKGRFKDTGSAFRPMSEQDKYVFDMMITNAYDQFVDDILEQRETQLADALKTFDDEERWDEFLFTRPTEPSARDFLLQIADGRIYTGEQAFDLGLVDELGSMQYVIDALSGELGTTEPPRTFEPRQRLTLFDLMSSKVQSALPDIKAWPTLQYRMIPF